MSKYLPFLEDCYILDFSLRFTFEPLFIFLNLIKKLFVNQYLFEEIYKRIIEHPNADKKLKKRPLFQDLEKAKALYDERLPQYLKIADIVVNVEGKSLEDIAKEILKKVDIS